MGAALPEGGTLKNQRYREPYLRELVDVKLSLMFGK